MRIELREREMKQTLKNPLVKHCLKELKNHFKTDGWDLDFFFHYDSMMSDVKRELNSKTPIAKKVKAINNYVSEQEFIQVLKHKGFKVTFNSDNNLVIRKVSK